MKRILLLLLCSAYLTASAFAQKEKGTISDREVWLGYMDRVARPVLSNRFIRCARKTLKCPSTFTKDGWLTIGPYGMQPSLGEFYIPTGSLYLCSNIFLLLGLLENR